MMISVKTKIRLTIMMGLVAMGLVNAAARPAQVTSQLPAPSLIFIGPEFFEANGKSWIRYKYAVENRQVFSDALFAASPELPPCGSNTRASRTWVDFYDSRGKRLNGFCALRKNSDLANIWFATEVDVIPPSYIYIELTDRQNGSKVKSLLTETTQ